MKLGNAKIERFREQHGFTEWLSTSAKTGENCSDKENGGQPSKLKQLIAESIPWDKLPWTSTPRLLAELKNAVMAMRDKSDIRLLRFSELAQRLEQALPGEKFGESGRAHGGNAAGQSRPGPPAEVWRPGAAATRTTERLRRGDHPRRPGAHG